jgi:hypothetical protein
MAPRTFLPELVIVKIVMAVLATPLDTFVPILLMARAAFDARVFSHQRKGRIAIVVERELPKIFRRMACCARLCELTQVNILMARVAIGCFRQPPIVVVDVTLFAWNNLVFFNQFIARVSIVLKLEQLPTVRDMAIRAALLDVP